MIVQQNSFIMINCSAASFAAVTENCAFSEAEYARVFDGIAVLSPLTKSGLTYAEEENIIKFGGCEYYPCNGYGIIETEGIRILCVTGKSEPPDMHYDLCIFCCEAEVNVSADRYLTADRDYKGKISTTAENVCCESRVYIADNGSLYPKEDITWLR